jgi:hypothetical protein
VEVDTQGAGDLIAKELTETAARGIGSADQLILISHER